MLFVDEGLVQLNVIGAVPPIGVMVLDPLQLPAHCSFCVLNVCPVIPFELLINTFCKLVQPLPSVIFT